MKAVFRILVGIIVLGTMALAFYLSGSPSENRVMRRDELRVSDLRALQRKVNFYFTSEGAQPESIATVVDWCTSQSNYLCRALGPDEATAYTIKPVDDRKYELCTTFERASPYFDPEVASTRPENHGIGERCYPYTYPRQRTRPKPSGAGG